MLKLPLELIRHTLDFLDQRSLKQTSLTCSGLRPLCQEHIFAILKLQYQMGTTDTPTRSRDLIARYQQSPAIAGYVKHLYIYETPWLNRSGHDMWLARDEQFPEAMELLSLDKLQTFNLDMGKAGPFEDLPEAVKIIIRKICQSPSLTRLDLSKAPVGLLNECGPSLKTLSLNNADISPAAKQLLRNAPIQLHDLRVTTPHHEDTIEIIGLLLDPAHKIDTARLAFLHCNIDTCNRLKYSSVNRLIATCSQCLRVLSLPLSVNLDRDTIDPNAAIELGGCRMLTELSIAFSMIGSADPLKVQLSEAIRIISSVSPDNQIKTINLNVRLVGMRRAGLNEVSLCYQLWKSLDALLSDRTRFGHLGTLELDVSDRSMPPGQPVAERIVGYFENLKDLGILDMKTGQGLWVR
ncbi:hypothetical protein FA15DRAFT_673517 [Coprinopsis marcescibilis]|uniref:F-box domain-containing protein n=1 Tax=Coprinopsis marcescibilis TaxID=230819 RepID=A0A5C3KKC4_COPMA|nr:hypothetical protein FA15DRAFT_673517 [Coprinopsis marcescibilis]